MKIPKSECPDIRIRLPRHNWPKPWSSMEDPVVPLERNLYGHPLAGLLWGKAIWENPIEVRLVKRFPIGNAYSYTVKKGLFLSVYADDIKLAGKKQNIDPMWKVLNKEDDLGEPTSFLDHVYLGLHSKTMWNKQRQEMCGTILWVGKQDDSTTLQSIYSMHWWPSFQRRRIEVCRRIVKSIISKFLKCLYLARIGRPDILWSVTKLARSITKWTKACDKRLSRLISYIHHTCEYKQCCYVGNTAKQCRLGLFQDSDFAGDLEDSKSTSGGTLCVFGSHTFVPISWMCKKQTSVSHSSTESEIISLDAGLRLDGIPALDLWCLIVLVLKKRLRTMIERCNPLFAVTQVTRKASNLEQNSMFLNNVDFIPSNVQYSHQEALLYVFEYNEAVIKITIKERSPNNETCFQNPQSCAWLGIRSNQCGPKNPNQVHWHQKPTRRHTDWPREISHTWWMESSFVSVQH